VFHPFEDDPLPRPGRKSPTITVKVAREPDLNLLAQMLAEMLKAEDQKNSAMDNPKQRVAPPKTPH
jgi:hypothetical protein